MYITRLQAVKKIMTLVSALVRDKKEYYVALIEEW